MKALALGILLAMAPVAALSQDGNGSADPGAPFHRLSPGELQAAVRYIESHVQLPNGARPLDDYDRYYAQKYGVVLALYSGPRLDETSGPHFVRIFDDAKDLPVVFDGGCSFIDLAYVPSTQALTARCHGEA